MLQITYCLVYDCTKKLSFVWNALKVYLLLLQSLLASISNQGEAGLQQEIPSFFSIFQKKKRKPTSKNTKTRHNFPRD